MKSTRGKTSSQTISWMAWDTAGRVGMLLVGVASVAVLARILTQEDYGVVAAATIFIGLARSGLVEGGFPAAIIQRQDLEPLHIRNAFTGGLIIHLVAAGLIWICAYPIAQYFDMPELAAVLRAMCVMVVLNPVLSTSRALLERRKRFRLLAIADIWTTVLASTSLSIALAFAGFGLWSLVISNIALVAAQTLVAFAFARFNPVPVITSHMRDLLGVSLGFSIVGALATYAEQAPRFIVGRLLGADSLGVFGRTNRVLQFPGMLLGQSVVLYPVMSDMNDDPERMARGYLRTIALCSLFVIPLTALLWHASEGLILLLLGDRWMAAIVPTQILSLALFFALGMRFASVVFKAMGKVKALLIRHVLLAVLITAGSIIGGRWGLDGVCIGILATQIVTYFMCAYLANDLLGIGTVRFVKANLPGVMLGLPVLAALIVGKSYVWHDANPYLQFPIEACVAGLLAYALCVIKPGLFLGPDGIWLLTEIRSRMPEPFRPLVPVGRK